MLYLRPRVLLMVPLGFAAGLPLLLTGTTLLAVLSLAGLDLRAVGAYALVGLPYALKFLWAPLLDRPLWPSGEPRWRRRGWLALTQLLLVPALCALGVLAERPTQPLALALLALLTAALSATQDIACDAYRAELLAPDEAAAGSAAYVLGYRVAMILAGAGALRFLGPSSVARVYGALALCLLPLVVVTALAPEPPPPERPANAQRPLSLAEPLRALWRRPMGGRLLAVVFLYRLGDALSTGLLLPFLLRRGYGQVQVADTVNAFGLGATIIGALLGGRLCAALPLRRALLGFGALQAGANLGYVALALRPPDPRWLYAVVGFDHLATGLGVAALGALLLSLCERRHSATHGAIVTSLSGAAGRLLAGAAGVLAQSLGWPLFFILSAALGLPALLVLLTLPDAALQRAPET